MSGEIRAQHSEVFVITDTEVMKIGNITQNSELGSEPGRIQTTNLDANRHTSIAGLESDSRFTVSINLDRDSDVHEWLEENRGSDAVITVAVADSQGAGRPTISGGAITWPTNRKTRHFPGRVASFQIGSLQPDGLWTATVGFDMLDNWTTEDAQ